MSFSATKGGEGVLNSLLKSAEAVQNIQCSHYSYLPESINIATKAVKSKLKREYMEDINKTEHHLGLITEDNETERKLWNGKH